MYKFLLILLSVVGMATATSAQQKQDMNSRQSNHKILVAYFSATGTTARAAQKVAHATGGELYAITPAQPYTDADLNWNDKQSRSSVEMNDPKARPAIKSQKGKIADYDVVFIGYPIWWHTAPMIIGTFLESYDLTGIDIYPFTQSASMDTEQFENSMEFVRKSAGNGTVHDGLFVDESDTEAIDSYLENNRLIR